MKSTERVMGLVLVIALLLSACTSDNPSEVADSTPTPVETPTESPTEVPTEVPAETPTPESVELTDDQKIAAAIAAFDADPQPTDLIAWDHLETNVRESRVDVVVCGWTGESVFDSVNQTTYRVVPGDDGAEPRVIFESDSTIPGDCLNTQLIESALQATRDYDTYWNAVLKDPPSFDPAEAGAFLTAALIDEVSPRVAGWAEDGLSWRGTVAEGQLPESAVEEVLWRRFEAVDGGILEVLACRDIEDDLGLYRGDVLVDDFKSEGSDGPHSIDQYRVRHVDGKLLVLGVVALDRADCFSFDAGWFEGVNEWRPDPTAWMRLSNA